LRHADFGEALVVASALVDADLRSVRWSGAQIASAFHGSDLRGAVDLTQAQLDASIGNAQTLLPDGTAPDTGRPFHILECWQEPPVAIENIVDRFGTDAYVSNGIRQPLLCPQGHEPSPTGTPLALDAPYPDGHLLAHTQIESTD
jgi:hypothetical protein